MAVQIHESPTFSFSTSPCAISNHQPNTMHRFKDKIEHEIDHLEDSLRGRLFPPRGARRDRACGRLGGAQDI